MRVRMRPTIILKIIDTPSVNLDLLLSCQGKIYTFLNPVSYLSALEHKSLFAQFDGIFADGSLLVKAIEFVYGQTVTRRSFDMTSLAPIVMSYAETKGKSVYIVASRQEEVEMAADIFRKQYPRLNIIGCRNGYFGSDEELRREAEYIVSVNPDILIVGMGVVIQEEFLLQVKRAGFQGIGFTCGGFIHQTAKGEADYYPAWVDRMNIRFLYRMWKEPHTRKRYLQAGLLFPAKFLYERFYG